jgi:hypothetical protein
MTKILSFCFLTFLVACKAQEKSATHAEKVNLELFETYERYDLKENLEKVVTAVKASDSLRNLDLTSLLKAHGNYPFAFIESENVNIVDSILNLNYVKALFPKDLIFLWSQTVDKRNGYEPLFSLYACKIGANNSAVLDGKYILHAADGWSKVNELVNITVTLNESGKALWAKISEENINHAIAICIDRKVVCAPIVYQAMTGDVFEISGNFTKQEAKDIAMGINAGITK